MIAQIKAFDDHGFANEIVTVRTVTTTITTTRTIITMEAVGCHGELLGQLSGGDFVHTHTQDHIHTHHVK